MRYFNYDSNKCKFKVAIRTARKMGKLCIFCDYTPPEENKKNENTKITWTEQKAADRETSEMTHGCEDNRSVFPLKAPSSLELHKVVNSSTVDVSDLSPDYVNPANIVASGRDYTPPVFAQSEVFIHGYLTIKGSCSAEKVAAAYNVGYNSSFSIGNINIDTVASLELDTIAYIHSQLVSDFPSPEQAVVWKPLIDAIWSGFVDAYKSVYPAIYTTAYDNATKVGNVLIYMNQASMLQIYSRMLEDAQTGAFTNDPEKDTAFLAGRQAFIDLTTDYLINLRSDAESGSIQSASDYLELYKIPYSSTYNAEAQVQAGGNETQGTNASARNSRIAQRQPHTKNPNTKEPNKEVDPNILEGRNATTEWNGLTITYPKKWQAMEYDNHPSIESFHFPTYADTPTTAGFASSYLMQYETAINTMIWVSTVQWRFRV